jgi:uncharacterized RDD family membrane protein YckC
MAFATTLNTGTRIVSMLSDHFIMTIIVMIISAPWFIILIMADQHMVVVNDLLMSIYAAAAFSVYFNKDIYLGQSIGKRLLRFKVVNKKTGELAGPLRCLVRNLTLFFWPIEAIVAMVNVHRRLGDYIAGTELVNYEQRPVGKPNWGMMVLALVLSAAIMYVVVALPMFGLMKVIPSRSR